MESASHSFGTLGRGQALSFASTHSISSPIVRQHTGITRHATGVQVQGSTQRSLSARRTGDTSPLHPGQGLASHCTPGYPPPDASPLQSGHARGIASPCTPVYPPAVSPKPTLQHRCQPMRLSGGSYMAAACPGFGMPTPAVSPIPPPPLLSARTSTLASTRTHSATRSTSTLPPSSVGGAATAPVVPPGFAVPMAPRTTAAVIRSSSLIQSRHAASRRPSKRGDGNEKANLEAHERKMTDLITSSAQAAAQAAAETAAEAAVKKALQATESSSISANTMVLEALAAISNFNTTQQQTREHVAEDSRKVALLHEEVSRMQIKVDQLQSQNDGLHEQLQVTQSGHEDSIRQLEELRATRRGCTTGEATRLPLEKDKRALELELEQLRKKLQDREKALGKQQVAATRQVTGADKEKHATQQQLQEHWQHIGALEEQLRQERLISNVATPADFLKMSKASEKENTSHENNKLKLDNARLKSDLDRCLDKLRAHEGGASNALRWGKVGGG